MKDLFIHAQERVSCETHAIGIIASFVGMIILLFKAVASKATALELSAALCFTLSALALYSASTLYHYCHGKKETPGIKRSLRKMDHCMIYVLIAGSYTPFTLILFDQPRGFMICFVIWCLTLVGILIKMMWVNAPRFISTLFYLIMGWLAVLFIKDFMSIQIGCTVLMILGGLCYTIGALFYIIKKPNINIHWTFHEIFHVFILGGSFLHYLAVYFYVL